MALTDTAIRGTKRRQKPFKVFDRDGLFLLVNSGGSKLWRWRYRFDGKKSSWRSVSTREAVAIDAGQSLKGEDVVRTLNWLKSSRGVPKVLFCDNGSEFTVRRWTCGPIGMG